MAASRTSIRLVPQGISLHAWSVANSVRRLFTKVPLVDRLSTRTKSSPRFSMQKCTRLMPSPSSTKSQVGCRPNQARSKFNRIFWPGWPPSKKMSSSMRVTFALAASIVQRGEYMDRRQSEHGSGGHHVEREPTAHRALQKQFRVHLVHPQSVLR